MGCCAVGPGRTGGGQWSWAKYATVLGGGTRSTELGELTLWSLPRLHVGFGTWELVECVLAFLKDT